MAALGADDPHDTPAMSMVRAAYRSTLTADKTFGPLQGNSHGQQRNSLTEQLEAGRHVRQGGRPDAGVHGAARRLRHPRRRTRTQQRLLQTLDEALTPFLADMATDRHGKDLVVMAYSEFGRRVRANASQGTDHGTAGPVFVAGAPVKGGFYGDEPSLTDLDDGDLKTTTDFRDVYHDLLVHTFGADPVPSVGEGRRDVGFL